MGGHFGDGEGESDFFFLGLRLATTFFFLATTFFFTTGLGVDVAFLVMVGLGEGAFVIVALGVGAFVAASAAGLIKTAIKASPINRLIALPLEFAYRKEGSNNEPDNQDGKGFFIFPRFSDLLRSKRIGQED